MTLCVVSVDKEPRGHTGLRRRNYVGLHYIVGSGRAQKRDIIQNDRITKTKDYGKISESIRCFCSATNSLLPRIVQNFVRQRLSHLGHIRIDHADSSRLRHSQATSNSSNLFVEIYDRHLQVIWAI